MTFGFLENLDMLFEALKNNNEDALNNLLSIADSIRAEAVRNQVCIHGIIEFSNYCKRNCLYCGIRKGNKRIKRYRMPLEEIKKRALYAIRNWGYKMIVLQSGEDSWYDTDKLCWLIKAIHGNEKRSLLFLSIGDRDYETYKKLYKAGARGSLYRFETSDIELYKKLHPGCDLNDRIRHIQFMQEIGYLTASGPIIGLPGQTYESLFNDIKVMRDLKVTMASMGPFIPTHNTPLEGESWCSVELILKMFAITRIVYEKVRIPITTASERLGGDDLRTRALNGGANAFMLNLTPKKYLDMYEIYSGKNKMKSHIHSKKTVDDLNNKIIKPCGRRICKGWGTDFTLNKQKFVTLCNMGD